MFSAISSVVDHEDSPIQVFYRREGGHGLLHRLGDERFLVVCKKANAEPWLLLS